jgi:hypothetical protein
MSSTPNPAASAWRPLLGLAALAAALTALTAAGPTVHLALGGWALMSIFAAGGAGIVLALRLADLADQRHALIVILLGALAMRLGLVFTEPYLSTDIYRYIWDGRVQGAGINPYRYLPNASELTYLRDAAIYPKINRADTAVTIYPPVAQAIFYAVTRLGDGVAAMKLGLVAFDATTAATLIALLRRLGRPVTRVAVYAWHPLPIWEVAGSGHVDTAMCALLAAGLLLFLHGRTLAAGVVVTLGALVKPTALLALPVFWRPWNWRLPLAVALAALVAYLPYLSVGGGVLGSLGSYVSEEGFASGQGFNVLWLMEEAIGPVRGAVQVYAAIAAVIMIALALVVGFRRDRSVEAALFGLSWLLVVFLVLASPHYPWYFVALVPMLALHPSATGWVLTLGSPLLYDSAALIPWLGYDTRIAVYTLATVAALVFDVRRLRRNPLNLTVGESHERPGHRPASVS